MGFLNDPFMVRALIAAALVGVTAPAIGTYLVQRRQAIMGDGLGHVAMTGVALGLVTNTSPVWMATLVAVVGAVAMEMIRSRGRTSGDVALSLLFYGGLAGGVMIVNLGGSSTSKLLGPMFGSITAVAPEDVTAMALLAAFVLAVALGLRRQLFAVCQDEEFAKVTGLPVRLLNLLIAVTAAVTVTVAMRIVGLLLVSAMMVIPVAAAQRITRGFAATLGLAIGISLTVSLVGTTATYYLNAPSGAAIVLLAIAVFMALTAVSAPLARRRAAASRAAEEVCTRDDVTV
ncbi:metal ABC transporter permease [Streptomyces lavendulae]|uniref:metal ABC transporter permease n=1 Tax=Streptomyces lavendulae TaxID=1914 RepID=UPI0024A213DE|nr:metal ABC transporter permease [Streptomyces lavendulae]GLV81461.1 ABC transporter [Streptomyces lavendulae subsp. lavendulae]GLV97110.1 ABC transporter [Streptomyces lavendulae subsp. lavendulae]GLX37352.1 ABC transporter [Streptomyces roseochromogenus]